MPLALPWMDFNYAAVFYKFLEQRLERARQVFLTKFNFVNLLHLCMQCFIWLCVIVVKLEFIWIFSQQTSSHTYDDMISAESAVLNLVAFH